MYYYEADDIDYEIATIDFLQLSGNLVKKINGFQPLILRGVELLASNKCNITRMWFLCREVHSRDHNDHPHYVTSHKGFANLWARH